MCGLNISFKSRGEVEKMCDRTSHRGETRKIESFQGIFLGHVRLAIQGLDHKYDCPFEINGDKYLLNGEIYNYQEIDPNAKSDVEVLGRDASEFDGDYAIAKVSRDGTVEVKTDHFGKRQLYYRESEFGRIEAISSEIKALVDPYSFLNEKYLATVARFGYAFGSDETPIVGIKRFLPGKVYRIKDQLVENIEEIYPAKASNETDAFPGIEELLELSTKRRLVSDVPIAVLYSGGLDSSIVLYHLKKLGANAEVFTIENEDDISYAKRYAKELGVKLNFLEPSELKYEDIQKYNELASDLGSFIPNFLLFEACKKKGYRVVMTADSADEAFSGYRRNLEYDFQQNDIYNELIYHHFPRLDQVAMANTIEYRSPFSADYVIQHALDLPYEIRKGKKVLREEYRGKIPDYILDREKTPLKSKAIREDKEKERIKLVEFYKNNFLQTWQ